MRAILLSSHPLFHCQISLKQPASLPSGTGPGHTSGFDSVMGDRVDAKRRRQGASRLSGKAVPMEVGHHEAVGSTSRGEWMLHRMPSLALAPACSGAPSPPSETHSVVVLSVHR